MGEQSLFGVDWMRSPFESASAVVVSSNLSPRLVCLGNALKSKYYFYFLILRAIAQKWRQGSN
jgi:hypothetical protein